MSVTVVSSARPITPHSHVVGDHADVVKLTATAETYDLAVASLRAQLPAGLGAGEPERGRARPIGGVLLARRLPPPGD